MSDIAKASKILAHRNGTTPAFNAERLNRNKNKLELAKRVIQCETKIAAAEKDLADICEELNFLSKDEPEEKDKNK